MPLVGLVDPSHAERKNKGAVGRLPVWYPLEEVLSMAANAEPKWSPWPYELLNAALQNWQERDYISTTMLTGGCPRGTVIERKEDFILEVDQLYASIKGTLGHRTLEHGVRPGAVAEVRFHTSVYVPGEGDVAFSCSPDIVTRDSLGDYKFTENPPSFDYPYRKHTDQLQLNRWVVNHAEKWELEGKPFDMPFDPRTWQCEHLYVVYLGPKEPKVIEVVKSVDHRTPNNKVVKRKKPYVMPDDMLEEQVLMPRLTAMVRALDAYPEWPTGVEEVWGGDASWDCPGPPLCYLPNCLAKRRRALTWPRIEAA